MRQLLVCSSCGMTSGRRWNLLRHINSKHAGEGTFLGFMDYLLKVQSGLIPYPTYSRLAGLPWINSQQSPDTSPTGRLLDHAHKRTLGIAIPKLSQAKGKWNNRMSLRLEICDRCLTYKIYYRIHDSLAKQISERTDHACDNAWILNNSPIFERRETVIDILKENAPAHLAMVVKELNPHGVVLMSIRFNPPVADLQREATANVAEAILERRHDINSFMVLAGLEALAHPPLENQNYDYPALSGLVEKCTRRACLHRDTELSDEELVEFLGQSNSTSFIAKVDGKPYSFFLLT